MVGYIKIDPITSFVYSSQFFFHYSLPTWRYMFCESMEVYLNTFLFVLSVMIHSVAQIVLVSDYRVINRKRWRWKRQWPNLRYWPYRSNRRRPEKSQSKYSIFRSKTWNSNLEDKEQQYCELWRKLRFSKWTNCKSLLTFYFFSILSEVNLGKD